MKLNKLKMPIGKPKPSKLTAVQPVETPRKRGRPAGTGYQIPASRAAALQAAGMTYSEISKELGISLTAVSRLLTRSKIERASGMAERLKRFSAAVREGDQHALELLNSFAKGINRAE